MRASGGFGIVRSTRWRLVKILPTKQNQLLYFVWSDEVVDFYEVDARTKFCVHVYIYIYI